MCRKLISKSSWFIKTLVLSNKILNNYFFEEIFLQRLLFQLNNDKSAIQGVQRMQISAYLALALAWFFAFLRIKIIRNTHTILRGIYAFSPLDLPCNVGMAFVSKCEIFPVHFLEQKNTIKEKGIEFCHKLKSSNPYICASEWFIPLIFQTKCVPLSSRLFSPLPN